MLGIKRRVRSFVSLENEYITQSDEQVGVESRGGRGVKRVGIENRRAEVAIAAGVLNRMLELGRPDSVRVG